MRAIRTTTISILAVGLLAGSAVGVAAQGEEATEGSAPVYVTATLGQPASVAPGTEGEDGTSLLGMRLEGMPVEASDPRLTGLLDIVRNGHADRGQEVEALLESRSYRLVTMVAPGWARGRPSTSSVRTRC